MNDRHKQALDMRNNGKTFREIGAFFGVSSCRASQMVSSAKRARDRGAHEFDALGTRIKNALLREGISNKTVVVEWLSAPYPTKVAQIGGLRLNIIREWAGVFEKEMKVENCGNCKYGEGEYGDKDGARRSSLEVRVNDLALLGKRDDPAPARPEPVEGAAVGWPSGQQAKQKPAPVVGDLDDDIPF